MWRTWAGMSLFVMSSRAELVDVVDRLAIILEAVLLPLFERLQRRGVTEELGRSLDHLCPRAPRAGGVVRLCRRAG